MPTWDANGKPVPDAQPSVAWDEKGNPIGTHDESGNALVKDPTTGETMHMVAFKDGVMPVNEAEWQRRVANSKDPVKSGIVDAAQMLYGGMLAGPMLSEVGGAALGALPKAAQPILNVAGKVLSNPLVRTAANAYQGYKIGGIPGLVIGGAYGAMGGEPTGKVGTLSRMTEQAAPEAEAAMAVDPKTIQVLPEAEGAVAARNPLAAAAAGEAPSVAPTPSEPAIAPQAAPQAPPGPQIHEPTGLPIGPDGKIGIPIGNTVIRVDPATIGKSGRQVLAEQIAKAEAGAAQMSQMTREGAAAAQAEAPSVPMFKGDPMAVGTKVTVQNGAKEVEAVITGRPSFGRFELQLPDGSTITRLGKNISIPKVPHLAPAGGL